MDIFNGTCARVKFTGEENSFMCPYKIYKVMLMLLLSITCTHMKFGTYMTFQDVQKALGTIFQSKQNVCHLLLQFLVQ